MYLARAKVSILSDQLALDQLRASNSVLAVYWVAKISGDLSAISKMPLD